MVTTAISTDALRYMILPLQVLLDDFSVGWVNPYGFHC